ncbi:FAD/NAD(P)-binding protein [Flavobacterium rhizosphaerae]|uniref:FAD/NAD(P)-binding protein n=1 Tax=Flavobacterium rhizosphaerae TaxID=3163298 RepID=A0ABW8YRI7_9FLAO
MEAGIKRIAIIGGGPSGMFILKQLLDADIKLNIHIFEKSNHFGCGMPYSQEGSGREHVTNVSGNEIPVLVTPVKDWVQTVPEETLHKNNISRNHFNDYKVLPRLFFGEYLCGQFDLLLKEAEKKNINVVLHAETTVNDIIDLPEENKVIVETQQHAVEKFDRVIICTGHSWPKRYEGKVPGYYDSPYPPDKLKIKCNHSVALKGASLTAIDALRTLSREHGWYEEKDDRLVYHLHRDYPYFNIVMHSRNGLMPAVRFHLEDSHLMGEGLLTEADIEKNIAENNGFLSLDYVFKKDYVDTFKDKDPDFYNDIKDLSIEQFVDKMLEYREATDPFMLLEREYNEADVSIKLHESVYWKEKLAVLSFAMNYPAKHFSAEDMLRLQEALKPLIAIVIAFIPQSSAKELLALHEAGLLQLVEVGQDSRVTPHNEEGAWYYHTNENGKEVKIHYQTYIDCTGQPHLMYEDVAFKSLLRDEVVSPAYLPFRSGREARKVMEEGKQHVKKKGEDYLLKVPGIGITDDFQVIGGDGAANSRIYMMAVPYIGGYNPDYSGLDFCEEASKRIVSSFIEGFKKEKTVPIK